MTMRPALGKAPKEGQPNGQSGGNPNPVIERAQNVEMALGNALSWRRMSKEGPVYPE